MLCPAHGASVLPDGALALIHVDELTPEAARQLDLPDDVRGVVVTNVDPDRRADELRKGYVIEEINQEPVTSVSDYNKIAASLDPSQPRSCLSIGYRLFSLCGGAKGVFPVGRCC